MVGAELMAASAEVIAARTGRMAQGLTSAKGQDFKELSLMSSDGSAGRADSANAPRTLLGAGSTILPQMLE